jgi:cardiolipin synthase
MRFLFRRVDIRNHRKVIVIDHRCAFTGSMNMVDPAHFNMKRGVGEWIDVMVRVEGPAARALDLHLLTDWSIEAGEEDRAVSELVEAHQSDLLPEANGLVPAQVVPSGPDQRPELIHEMLVTLIYNTKRRLVITTPYFVPSEPMLNAIISAAHRGVRVSLVLPSRVDSVLVRHASRAYFQDLLEAGVEVYAYKGGLLHSKTVTADQDVGLIGSVNMDLRSFSINFEMSLFVYQNDLIEQLRELQGAYIEDSARLELQSWETRPVYRKALEHLLQLLSPIL